MQISNTLHDNIGHYMAGLITKEELRNVAWGETKTIEELPNGLLLVECRKSGLKKTI